MQRSIRHAGFKKPAIGQMAKRCLAMGLAATMLLGCHQQPVMSASTTATADAGALAARARGLDAWRDENIYFILTDRFNNGDHSNDFNVNAQDPNAYHGGDFEGIIRKLDYIKDLGATAIWITPINDNNDDAFVGKYWGFHGYWIKDFNKVDEHLGDEAKFKELVRQAHARGIKVLLDMVVNHAGYDSPMAADPKYHDWFHHNGNIQNWDDEHQLEYDDIQGLPDFNTENPDVINFMETTWAGWIKRTGIDGFRMDTVKHVPIAFWSQFNPYIHAHAPSNFLLLGEVLHGDPNYLSPYTKQGQFDSLFDFPMYFTINDVFAKGGSMRELGDRLRQDGAYRDATMLSPFLDNHDVPRFMSQAGGDENKLRLALAFLYTMRGIPMMYYGTEVGMKGAGEPDNRADMAWGSNPQLTSYVKTLMHLRLELEPLRRGRMLEMWQDDQVYGYSRLDGSDEVITVLNNDAQSQTRDIPLRAESALADGTVLVDRLSGDRLTVSGHKLHVTLAGKQARILAVATSRKH